MMEDVKDLKDEVRNDKTDGKEVRGKKYFAEKSVEYYARNKEKLAQKRLGKREKLRERNATDYQRRKALKKQQEDNDEQKEEKLAQKRLEVERKNRERNARNYQRRKALKKQQEGVQNAKPKYPKSPERKNIGKPMMLPGGFHPTWDGIRESKKLEDQRKIKEKQQKLEDCPMGLCKACEDCNENQNCEKCETCEDCKISEKKRLKERKLWQRETTKQLRLVTQWETDCEAGETTLGLLEYEKKKERESEERKREKPKQRKIAKTDKEEKLGKKS